MPDETSTEESTVVYEATLTMRSGAMVTAHVTKLKTRTNAMGPGLTWVSWTDAPSGPRLHAVDVAEIAAVVLRDLPGKDGEPTEGVPADPGATGKPAKVEVEHVMDDPNPPDWGGEETDEGTPIYHAAWDSQDGSARVWAGPYAGGLTDGWALSVEAETASILLRCSTDQLIDWAESVRKAIEDSRANLRYVEQDGGS